MAVAIFFALMLGLLVFIIWDRRRPVAPLSREAMKEGWPRSPVSSWPVFAGFSVLSAALGFSDWLSPSHPPFTGRWSSAHAALYDSFGPKGAAYFFAALAIGLAVVAVALWRWAASSRRGDRAVKR